MEQAEETLKDRISRLIAQQGPITVNQFIALCLSDKTYGYYHHGSPFGGEGDFITAPEVSQMFGEMLGLWSVALWQQMDKPTDIVFCEIGSGRGTLMDDMLRTIGKVAPDFLHCAQIILVETSEKLRRAASEKLSYHRQEITFLDNINELPPRPLVLIGNEWLDCLPIHQYQRTSQGWLERMVSLDEQGQPIFVMASTPIVPALLPDHAMTAEMGTIVEISPAREAVIERLSHHLITHKGAALLIDYGSLTQGFGDTLQAMSKHKFTPPLQAPGLHDLTSHVDFAALGKSACQAGCVSFSMTQAAFLDSMGIEQRAARLCHGRDAAFQQKINCELERLTSPQEMGELFKVFCLSVPEFCPFPFFS